MAAESSIPHPTLPPASGSQSPDNAGHGGAGHPLSSTVVLCALAGLLAAGASLGMLRHGIRLPPDAWSYWEGSVSLLHGKGYRDFLGHRVWSWPPGYSSYLAGWESWAGVSGRTVAWANMALAGVAAVFWSLAMLLPLNAAARGRKRTAASALLPIAGVIFVALAIASGFRAAMAHNLVWTIYPLALYLTWRTASAANEPSRRVLAIITAFVLSLLVLTHYSMVFLPPLVGTVVLIQAGWRRPAHWIAAGICAAVPLGAWVGVRLFLGTMKSHQALKPKFSWKQYAHQIVSGMAKFFGDDRHRHVGEVLALGLLIVLGYALFATRKLRGGSQAARTYLFLTGGFLLCEYIAFQQTYIYERLDSDRFMLFVALTVLAAAAMLWTSLWRGSGAMPLPAADPDAANAVGSTLHHNVVVSAICAAMFCAVAVMAGVRTAKFMLAADANAGAVDVRRAAADRGFGYNTLTIDPVYPDGPPMDHGTLILVSPAREPQRVRTE